MWESILPCFVLSGEEWRGGKKRGRKSEMAATFASFQQFCGKKKSNLRGTPNDHRNPADLFETRTKPRAALPLVVVVGTLPGLRVLLVFALVATWYMISHDAS